MMCTVEFLVKKGLKWSSESVNFFNTTSLLTALPFAGFGAPITLLLFKVELSIYAFVGIIMLIGLVKKNGIMMINFAIAAQLEGKSAHNAIHEACVIRLRPIMMTTMAALMAGLPISFGYGGAASTGHIFPSLRQGNKIVSQYHIIPWKV